MNEKSEKPQVYFTESPPTPRQLELIVELCHEGQMPTTRQEASELIQKLLADPLTSFRQEYSRRMQEGPNWLIWEKWMTHIGRKEYDAENHLEWWKEVQQLAESAGITPPVPSPLPPHLKGCLYHSPSALMEETHRVLKFGRCGESQVELSVSCKEEVAAMKALVKGFLEDLRTIDEDSQWMRARLREGWLDEKEVAQIFREASCWVSSDPLNTVERKMAEKALLEQYKAVHFHIRNVKKQLKSFLKEVAQNFGR